MATLHLIRHGQASFGRSNYDKLSDHGWQQGRVTGRYLKQVMAPGALFRGDLERHRETAEAIAEGFETGLPEARVDAAFNEFDHLEVLQRHRPEWADPQQMAADLGRAPSPRKAFQEAFSDSVERWVSGQFDHEYSETWAHFCGRVWQGLETALESAAGARDTLVITSGGPISVIVQRLLGLDDKQALELNAVMANTGITRVLYSGSGSNTRRTLAGFNSIAHLDVESAKMVTYR